MDFLDSLDLIDGTSRMRWRHADGRLNKPLVGGAVVIASALVGLGWMAAHMQQPRWQDRVAAPENLSRSR